MDAGIAADFGEHWTVGVSGQNLMSRDIDTKDIRIRNGRTGEVVSYKDTYQIRPLAPTVQFSPKSAAIPASTLKPVSSFR